MKKLIKELKNISFITELKEVSGKSINPKKRIIISISKSLIQEKEYLNNLYDLLNSQSFFEWNIEMKD